jgi:hypothetical protein
MGLLGIGAIPALPVVIPTMFALGSCVQMLLLGSARTHSLRCS